MVFQLFHSFYRRLLTMSFRYQVSLLSLLVLSAAVAVRNLGPNATTTHCRSVPHDASWPSQSDWDSLNHTVGGKLIATVPIAAACHNSLFSQSNLSRFNQPDCDALRNVWYYPETHLPSSSSPMAYTFSNNSCNPWLDPASPCTLGFHVAFSVNATSTSDFQAAIKFTREHNVRLAIRNTGHDYLGKSTGAHALSIWTHYMKSMNFIKAYQSTNYTGPAVKLSAGVESIEAYSFAHSHGVMLVGGNCPTVGLAGGYTQGGGHGPLASKYGLSADQVLEWEVVTGTGELLIATQNQNSDLFWALRGGGGGTYGVVSSVTVKAFSDTFFSTAYLTILNNGTNADDLYHAVGLFIQTLPSLVDAGVYVVWVAAPFGFMLMPAIVPGLHSAGLDEMMQPLLDDISHIGLDYQYSSSEHPSFLTAYNSLTSSWNVSDYNIGGRLIPRSLVDTDSDALLEAIRYISSRTLMSGVTFNLNNGVSSADEVGANPYLRKSLFSVTVGTLINYTDWNANRAAQDMITYDLLPKLQAITPNGGVYLNEADFQAPDFKETFYGDHYQRLLQIKDKYDPDDIFYAQTAVGSDRWKENLDGRLCRV
ncbi:FAD-binding domain-containing protein [Hypoxylon rubiginosum]|uniref:FAD-binding domain-containing protein n=1 Tax=Hypoxylon rubiginosum TaxID=110542 RepID=A0ACB9YHA6_9PEZI|nr:FAD-binding domain-containing protein [Hypoxylon rubiginosum]